MNQPLIDAAEGKVATAFTIKWHGGSEAISHYDADLLHLLAQVEDKEKYVQATPRYLLACLSTKYDHKSPAPVKAVAGRLRYWKNRGYLEEKRMAGLISPAWARTLKFSECFLLFLEAEKSGKLKSGYQFTLSIQDPVKSVLQAPCPEET